MQITIRADEGKWLTDGEHFGKTISLAEGVTIDDYHEITDKEYETMIIAETEEL